MPGNILPLGRHKLFQIKKDPQITPHEDLERANIEQVLYVKQKSDEEWTTEYSVDQLFLNLVSIKEPFQTDKGKIILVRKYYRQARQLMYLDSCG